MEQTNKGYTITDYDNTGMLEIQRIDEAGIFLSDAEAVIQAAKDGILMIPVEELPQNFERWYYGWIDTPENRQRIEAYCRQTDASVTN